MKRKIVAATVSALLVFCMYPCVALAADTPLADGATLDISTLAAGDTVTVAAGASVTISGTQAVQITCGAGTKITLSGATIDNSATANACPISFTGSGNKLILAAGTTNTVKAGSGAPGIRAGGAAELTIQGSGSLAVTGGYHCAGIGSEDSVDGGNITILGGKIDATGGQSGAAIGGGYEAGGGTIKISGTADVQATGGDYAAGIGSGDNTEEHAFDGGDIQISGGSVTAKGGGYSAGIGGGEYASGGHIQISGGTVHAIGADYGTGIGGGTCRDGGTITISGTADVTAQGGMGAAGIGGSLGGSGSGTGSGGTITITGGKIIAIGGETELNKAAGIGGGDKGSGGDITISGGIVFATGTGSSQDIGAGQGSSGGTLGISGDAAVFMRNDRYISPVTTTTHVHQAYTGFGGGTIFGYNVAWTGDFGAFIRQYNATYYNNDGTGNSSQDGALHSVSLTIRDGSALAGTYAYHTFGHWNTKADGSGDNYAGGESVPMVADIDLYAQWTAHPALTSSVAGGGIFTGGRITLTPNIPGGTWSFDSALLTRNGNEFTGKKAGTADIMYTVEGQPVTYRVTIQQAELPSTGQDFTPALWLLVLAGLAGAMSALLIVRKRKIKN